MSIEIRSLKKKYDDFEVEAELRVDSDEILVIAGPSGCGKTTALQMIAGLIKPDSGHVLIDGIAVDDLPAWKRGIGIVFQDLALFPHLSVGGNVGYGPFIAGMERRKRTDVISRSLAAVRLSGYEKRRVDTLSGGERQRVAIARALAASPRALLMDEPFSSLDAPLRRSLRAEFKELRSRERFPCIFVTHDREEAAAVGDRIAVMHEGRIIECGTPTRLFNEPKTAFVARFLGSGSIVPILAVKRSAEGCSEVLTPFGGISLPFAVSMDQALVVPPDAVSLETANSDQKTSRMRVVSTGFEGDATEVLLETENHTPIRASLNRRIIPPKIGDMVGARIDWSLSRPVI